MSGRSLSAHALTSAPGRLRTPAWKFSTESESFPLLINGGITPTRARGAKRLCPLGDIPGPTVKRSLAWVPARADRAGVGLSPAACAKDVTRNLMIDFVGKLLFLPLVLAYVVALALALIEVARSRAESAQDEPDDHRERLGRQ